MKKIMLCLLAFSMVAATGCSKQTESGNPTQSENPQTNADTKGEAKKVDLPYGEDIGTGTMYIATPAGTSEDGNIPDLLVSNAMMIQIGLNAWGFDGSLLSYVYFDGEFYSKEQLADTQTSITLQGDMLKPGEHTISVVQYANNEEGGEIVTYKEGKFNGIE